MCSLGVRRRLCSPSSLRRIRSRCRKRPYPAGRGGIFRRDSRKWPHRTDSDKSPESPSRPREAGGAWHYRAGYGGRDRLGTSMTRRIVLDTNIVLSALLFPAWGVWPGCGTPGSIGNFNRWFAGILCRNSCASWPIPSSSSRQKSRRICLVIFCPMLKWSRCQPHGLICLPAAMKRIRHSLVLAHVGDADARW